MEELPTRTWGAYPEIQKDYQYSDQCISAYISKMEEMAGLPREVLGERQPGERNMYELHNEMQTKAMALAP
jgi:hypothetical protein